MTDEPLMITEPIARLIDDIRAVYSADAVKAPERINTLLATQLAGRPDQEKASLIRQVMAGFRPVVVPADSTCDKEALAKVFGLIMGRQVVPDEVSSPELIERLAQSLNTIFDTLNQLIGQISSTFSGSSVSGDQTIRRFIGFQLEGEDQSRSLQAYMGQISEAFLTTQEAFKSAATAKVKQILEAIDPDKVAAERSGGIKIGPLKKAQDFEILKEKIQRIQNWFESGRFMDDYLREFEKNCRNATRK